jgi:hypothetical protein
MRRAAADGACLRHAIPPHAAAAHSCARNPLRGPAFDLATRPFASAFGGTVTAAVPTLRQGGRLHTGGGDTLSPLRGSERPRSHRFAAQSGPAPPVKSAAYPHPQWRRTPRYARLSRRLHAPRLRGGAATAQAAAPWRRGAGAASTSDAPTPALPPPLTAPPQCAGLRQTARAFGTPYRLMPQPLTHARATRYAGRPSTLRRARSRQHSAVRSPPPCLRFGKAEDFTRGAGILSHRFAAQSGPALTASRLRAAPPPL